MFLFFFNDPATTEIYTLSLHDALPIFRRPTSSRRRGRKVQRDATPSADREPSGWISRSASASRSTRRASSSGRSEEHTSELQSHVNLVCRLLLEKKKINTQIFSTTS